MAKENIGFSLFGRISDRCAATTVFMLTPHETELSGSTANTITGCARDDPSKRTCCNLKNNGGPRGDTETESSKYFCEPPAVSLLLDSLISLYEPTVLALGDRSVKNRISDNFAVLRVCWKTRSLYKHWSCCYSDGLQWRIQALPNRGWDVRRMYTSLYFTTVFVEEC